jgi:LysR family transcriptional regulator (chromosome initiation inhibitor)
MCPAQTIAASLAAGDLVEVLPGRQLDIDLYWQSWRLSIGLLDEFTTVLKKRAAQYLS